jgi:hypothetical protein
MMALFIAITAVAVERFINRRRLRLHEVLADVGWLTLLFAFIEFGYLYFVEALTVSHKDLARPLWHTEWPVFKDFLLNTAAAVLLILTSVWIESAGIRIELRRLRMGAAAAYGIIKQPPQQSWQKKPERKCDIEWHEAS